MGTNQLSSQIYAYNEANPKSPFNVIQTTVEEVYQEILKCKPSKSSGVDAVTMLMIKEIPLTSALCICHLINCIIRSKKYPRILKLSKIYPIKKPGLSATDIDSYRPINSLSSVDNIVEGILVKQISSYFEENNIIGKEHHSGRKGHSTLTAFSSLSYENSRNIEKQRKSLILTSDLKSGFDIVD